MLASLLPGVREVRAPLIAGYLWLLGLWILFEPGFHDKTNHSELFDSLGRLAGLMSPLGLGIAVSVAAYLLGALVIGAIDAGYRGARGMRLLLVSSFLETPRRSRAMRVRPSLVLLCDQLADSALVRLEQKNTIGANIRTSKSDEWMREAIKHFVPQLPASAGRDRWHSWISQEIYYRTIGEFSLVSTRLMIKSPELFATVDRLRSEAELRIAAAWSLPFVLASAASISGSIWWLVGMLVLPPLLKQAAQRAHSAELLLSDALLLGTVTSPSIDRLNSLVRELVERGRAPRWEHG